MNPGSENPKQIRQLRHRVIAFVLLHLLIIAHLVSWYVFHNRHIGAIDMQDLFRKLIEQKTLTVGALFFLIFIALSLVWGRFFCGWLCHIGQTYDLLAALYRRLGLRMGTFSTRFGPFMAGFLLFWYFLREAIVQRQDVPLSVDWAATEPWELLPGWLNGSLLLVLVLLVLPMLLGPRSFCRHLCPWGIVLGMANRIARLKVRRVANCTNCGACGPACPMDIDVSRQINTRFHVASNACTNCLQCVAACPSNALAFTFSTRENRAERDHGLLPSQASLPLNIELPFWGLTLVVGLTYDELYGVGIFLAYSLGLLLAWASLKLRSQFALGISRWLPALLVILLLWAAVVKDAWAGYHWELGHKAWQARDFATVQMHYEQADTLFWRTPTVLMYRLYLIYKASGQEDRRQLLYDRYELRRKRH